VNTDDSKHTLSGQKDRDRSADGVLQHNELLFQAVWDTIPDAIAVSAPDGTVLAANPAYYRLYGYTAEEVLGNNFSLIFSPAERAYAQELYAYMFRSPVIGPPVESAVKRADGTELFVESRYSFISNNGERVAMVSIIRDITERKKTEETLRGSQQLLQFVMEITQSATWEWDIASNIIHWSDNQKFALGIPVYSPNLTYEDFLAQVHPEDRTMVDQKIKEAIEQGVDYHLEFRTILADGSAWWTNTYGQVIYDETGKAVRMIGVSPDISRRKRAET
jgi:PAS domain S-box-containing protein